jgi:hypothetical protein
VLSKSSTGRLDATRCNGPQAGLRGHGGSDNPRLGAHGIVIRLGRAVQAIEVGYLNDVIVNDGKLTDTGACQRCRGGTAGTARPDHRCAEAFELIDQRGTKCEDLPCERRRRCSGVVGLVDLDAPRKSPPPPPDLLPASAIRPPRGWVVTA